MLLPIADVTPFDGTYIAHFISWDPLILKKSTVTKALYQDLHRQI